MRLWVVLVALLLLGAAAAGVWLGSLRVRQVSSFGVSLVQETERHAGRQRDE